MSASKEYPIPQPAYEKRKFEGKVVIVTGSSSGIGQAAALLFALEGASVTIHGQNAERLKACAEIMIGEGVPSSRILSVIGPVEDDKVLQKLIDDTVKKFGRIDILVNNAGIGNKPSVPLTDNLTMENYEYVMNANLRAPIRLTELVIPHLAKTRGNVINISSVGAIRAAPTVLYYSVAKAGLDHFTRNAAVLYAKHGIRVNGINPGVIDTAFGTRQGIPQALCDHITKDYTNKNTLLKRPGIPHEMATVIKFLASDDASYITGTNIIADGGAAVYVPGFEIIETLGSAAK